MDRLRKLLSSPLSRRKSTSCPAKTFGVPLEALVEKNSPQGSVPFVVNRLCSFIVENGLKQEGLFRIGGNARLIEKLKAVIDQTGDALLETEGDVPSAASLLKLFLRELPEPVVPASLCPEFLNAVRNCGDQRQECAMRLKCLVEKMPSENFNLLKYLSQFLKEVADHKEQNRMGPLALGIVFGPNIFRFSDDMKGLKDQSVTNQVIGYFITDYYAIFEGDSELYSTKTSAVRQEKEPLTIERKSSKLSVPIDSEKPKRIATTPTSVGQSLAFEPLSIVIPPLEKYVIQEKQVPALIVDRVVEQTINQRITKHLFGEHTKEPYSVHLSHKRKRKERRTLEEESKSSRSNSEERLLDWGPVTEDVTSIRRCSSHEEITPKESIENAQDNADQKQVLNVESREKQFVDLSPHPPQAKRRDMNGSKNLELPVKMENQKSQPSQHQELNDEHEARRSAERLAPFRRSPIGKIRRSPSRTLHRSLDLDSKNQTSSEEKERKCSIPDRLTSGVSVSLNDDSSFSHTDSEPCKENVHLTEGVSRKQEETHKLSTFCTIHNMPGNQFIDGQFRSTFVDHLNFHGHDEIHNSHHSHHHHHKGYSEECLSHPMLELHPMENSLMGRGENDQKNGSPGENSAAKDDSSVIAFTSLYEGADGTEPVLSEHRYSWPLVRPGREDDTALSPSFHYLRKSNSLHLDPSLPPSPPVEQNIFHKSPHKRSEEAVTVKQVNKKIHTLKKKIRKFEETFESEHGFRPSHAEKMNYPEIKKLLQELSEARKDLKYLKEEQCTVSEEGVANFQRKTELLKEEPDYKEKEISECDNNLNKPTVEESLEVALKSLSDKRRLAQRPDDIEKMTKEQIMDEKIAIQKALLRFESIHGRPTPISDRELVRPLYDRYRTMKRLVTRYNLVGGIGGKGKDLGSELQPILEHVAMDFISPQPREEGMEEGKDTALSTEKLVQPDSKPQTLNEVPITIDPVNEQDIIAHSKSDVPPKYDSSNLHELPLAELLYQQHQARTEKRRLRRVLRGFEDDFQKQTGRKVQKEDRNTMESVYGEYKHLKARLRLLEALVSKHEHHRMM